MSGWDLSDLTLPEVPPARKSGAQRKLALTILFHPDIHRIGERGRFTELDAGLSRLHPLFEPVRGASAERPLEDSYVSRSPVSFQWQGDKLQITPPVTGASLKVDGVELKQPVLISPAQLEQGVVLALAHRVVLLLHRAPRQPVAEQRQGLVGEHDSLQSLRDLIPRVAETDTPVLLLGESGTGKELVAQAIQAASPRSEQPLVSVNMAAIPAELAAAELFGVRRGAFTGAEADRQGYFQQANRGTLFLDEIGACDAGLQAQLLRALQQGEIQRPGGGTESIDVRILAATDADPKQGFSTALRHRLAGFEIHLPPLRQRREDLGRLLMHFLPVSILPGPDETPQRVSEWADLVSRMALHDWPGNIRQLGNSCRQLAIANTGQDALAIPESLKRELQNTAGHSYPTLESDRTAPSDNQVREAMLAARWEVSRAARELEMSRQALYRRIESIPGLRTASDISASEIESAFHDCRGDLEEAAQRLEVSAAALRRRWRAMDLPTGSW